MARMANPTEGRGICRFTLSCGVRARLQPLVMNRRHKCRAPVRLCLAASFVVNKIVSPLEFVMNSAVSIPFRLLGPLQPDAWRAFSKRTRSTEDVASPHAK